MNKIFISYSSKDQEWVRNWLLLQLESNSLHAHIDFRDFEIGQPSLVNMERVVEECAKTLLVLTPNYVQSEFTNFEAFFLADYHLEVVFGTTCRKYARRRDVPPRRFYHRSFVRCSATSRRCKGNDRINGLRPAQIGGRGAAARSSDCKIK